MCLKPYVSLLCGMLVCTTVISSQGQAKVQYEWGMLLVDGDKVKQDTITGRQ